MLSVFQLIFRLGRDASNVYKIVNQQLTIKFATEMKVIYGKMYLKELHLTGRSNEKKYWFQPPVVKRYIKVVNIMMEARDIRDLSRISSLRYEKLKGDKKGLSSVSVSDKYRIEFEDIESDGEIYASICRLTELSNHDKQDQV